MSNKSFTYLLKLNQESEEIFSMFSEKLNWNKKETILKSLYMFREILSDLEEGKKLVIQVCDEKSGIVLKEKAASFELLRSPN